MHGAGNSDKEGNRQAHSHNVPKIPSLPFSLPSMHSKVGTNILKEFRIRKWKVSFSRIINHSN